MNLWTPEQLLQITQGTARGQWISANSISMDTRTLSAGALYIALRGERQDGHRFLAQAREKGAVGALVNEWQDDPLPQIKVADTVRALGQLAQWWRQQHTHLTVIAITGSNGKTSVKEMTRAIFATQGEVLATTGNFNNHIGLPLTLLRLEPHHRYAVLEMGANHPGEIAYLAGLAQPDMALVNNVGPAHLQGFGSIEGVAAAKAEIYQALRPGGIAVINADDAFAGQMQQVAAAAGAQCIRFGITAAPVDIGLNQPLHAMPVGTFVLQTPIGEQKVTWELLGKHNVLNALAASALAYAAHLPLAGIAQGLSTLKVVPGRLQKINSATNTGQRVAVQIINDTYNANLASLKAALAVLADSAGQHWVALGMMGELGDYSPDLHREAGAAILASGVSRLFAVGEACQASVAAFGAGGCYYATQEDMIQAIQAELAAIAAPADSPPATITLLVKGSRSMQMERVVAALS